MSRRIAHRPRYHQTHQFSQPLLSMRQQFFPTRWSYRRQQLMYEKRPLGYSLSFLPVGYRLLRSVIQR